MENLKYMKICLRGSKPLNIEFSEGKIRANNIRGLLAKNSSQLKKVKLQNKNTHRL